MKKRTLLLALSLVSLTALPVFADDIKDNSLVIDSNRLEQEGDSKSLGNQSDMVKDLFSEEDQKKLKTIKEEESQKMAANQEQLFTSGNIPVVNIDTVSLFSSNDTLLQTRVEEDQTQSQSTILMQMVYLGLVISLILLATYLSYRVYRSQ
ncbi:type VII secretion protein EssA [Streptococcus loxodontisalivarius]|uniref:Type VII secretion protein EssA n=1 Tax=Streptococcus loxodontisalivarius TaxID=1349415 RepID=A0ABS2PSP4_9STRE|nr:type VII secretion protein EssA [Streptococcus loxodontisalivarius]MBM7643062.1 type VII secretion protein EssA [Streptococcus loxodontisalivarius]